MAIMSDTKFNELNWESKEFDWTGKSFYFIPIMNVFGKPISLGNKLEELNRELRMNGYRTVNTMMMIEVAMFKGRIMVEVEKLDKYDSQVITFIDVTTAETIVHKGSTGSLGATVKRLQQRVASRRGMNPHHVYYWLVDGPGSEKAVLFAVT